MARQDEIREAYRVTGDRASFYDGMMTYSTILGKAVCRLVWNMGADENAEYLERALAGIPDGFAGRLLEVPVGTGVLTMPIYRGLGEADVTCLDYSEQMMDTARRRADGLGLKNVRFVQGDVGALPFGDETFDIVVSMNGFHAFPDKEAAYRETWRVLRRGGTFCGCFYLKGCCKRTDWIISHLYERAGFFTAPYETPDSLLERLSALYAKVEVTHVESIGCFRCEK